MPPLIYQKIIKPVLFKIDAETVHDVVSVAGEFLGKNPIVSHLFSYKNDNLSQKICGLNFPNPIGLSAGFDYNGHLVEILPAIGFGFNTVGTVTAKPYRGNPPPRLARLPKSQSLFVNKGFKSCGVIAVAQRLDKKNLKASTLGVSIGSSNLPEIDTTPKAIDDYLFSFNYLKNKSYIKYFELNISCPNTTLPEPFKHPKNLKVLLSELEKINLTQPVFIKMPNEIHLDNLDLIIKTSLKYPISGFILSNLVKDRTNRFLNSEELLKFKNLKGNFSGQPCAENADKLIAYVYKKYGKDTKIIGCGGIFSARDAYEKIKLGASLVQLITGLVYEGPQLIGDINRGLIKLLEKDGFKNISEITVTS